MGYLYLLISHKILINLWVFILFLFLWGFVFHSAFRNWFSKFCMQSFQFLFYFILFFGFSVFYNLDENTSLKTIINVIMRHSVWSFSYCFLSKRPSNSFNWIRYIYFFTDSLILFLFIIYIYIYHVQIFLSSLQLATNFILILKEPYYVELLSSSSSS